MRWERVTVAALTVMLMAGCSGGPSSPRSDQGAPATTAAANEPRAASSLGTPSTTPATRLSPFDDLNQDGVADPTCGTRDFKAGLVLRVPCEPGYHANDPSEGTTLLPNSLSGLPGLPDDVKEEVLTNVSANAVFARDNAGKLVIVFFIQSDTLFATGSASLSGPARDTLDGLVRNIMRNWPTAPVQVRGHTDSTGSPSVNQTLSDQRAANVATYLASQGIDQARLSAVGLASTLPLVLEDGELGRRENRRVELVIRVP